MKKLGWTIAVVAAILTTGCATTRPPISSGFADIPVPKGLAYQPARSIIIESPNVKAAHLVYRGRITPDSLGVITRATLEANGWRHVSTNTTTGRGTVQVYDKGDNSLQVAIYEGFWFTYVTLGASQTLPMAPAAVPTARPAAMSRADDASPTLETTTPASLSPSRTPARSTERSLWQRAKDSVKQLFGTP